MNSLPLLYTRKVFRIALVLIVVIVFSRVFIFEMGRVNGRSMEPTLFDEEVFIVNKLLLLIAPPKRGDIVQFFDPNANQLLIKRVVGLPGEQIKLSKNKVFIVTESGEEVEIIEPYLSPEEITDSITGDSVTYFPIPGHNYYVLGDNRDESTDSRHFGTISRALITGQVISW